MKFLFDQNLSHRLVELLAAEFPGSQHVRDAGMAAASDSAVWSYAAQEGFVIVSKDTDLTCCDPVLRILSRLKRMPPCRSSRCHSAHPKKSEADRNLLGEIW